MPLALGSRGVPKSRLLGGVLIGLSLALGVLAACSPKKMMAPDVPPETTLFVQGPVDPVNHVVHLYWFGTDPDGNVVGYEVRFLGLPAPRDTDSTWAFTTRTDSIFTVFTPGGATNPIFEVRAIDNAGLKDATPAREDFRFTNLPPTVRLLDVPRQRDTTFASVTVTWTANDPDGDASHMKFRIWLDGNEAQPDLATGSSFTVPTAQFRRKGVLTEGMRTLFIQPIDDGGLAGSVDSTSWFVRAPATGGIHHEGRILLIDDVPSSVPVNYTSDTLYANAVQRTMVPPEAVSLLRLEFTQPFRSSKDIEQTFELFDAVVWYRSTQTALSTVLSKFSDGIGAYLNAGGRFYLEGLDLFAGFNTRGSLPEDFASRYLDTDHFFRYFSTSTQDSTAGWGNFNGTVFRTSIYCDSLKFALLPMAGIRGFVVRDTNEVAVWAPERALSPANPIRLPVAVSVPQASGGRAIVLTCPIRGAFGYPTGPRFLSKVFQDLLEDQRCGPTP